MIAQAQRRRGLLLATGQTTSYAAGDDGATLKGIVKAYTVLTLGQYSGTTAITLNGKTDTHSNNCVRDDNTGLIWQRTKSATVGTSGRLAWTTNGSGEGIFPYCTAANAAALSGYSDWRIPNAFELSSLFLNEGTDGIDATAFPTISGYSVWSSTTFIQDNTVGFFASFWGAYITNDSKTTEYSAMLVRG